MRVKPACLTLAALFVVISPPALRGETTTESQERGTVTHSPPPTGELLEKARRTVQEVHGEAIASVKTPDEALMLTQKLIEKGLEATGDPATRYALYEAARQVAERAGKLESALRACDQIGQSFDVDVLEMKEASLSACLKAVRQPTDLPPLAEGALQLADDAIEADQYAVAERLAAKAMDMARRSRRRDLLTSAAESSRQAKSLARDYEPVRSAKERLRTEPGHAASHAIVGRFLCLAKGDWEQGLAHLAQGDDDGLRTLAGNDRALPTDADQRLALGDAWLAQAKVVRESERPQTQQRAAHWYRLAQPGLAGFDKARVEKALKTLTADNPAAGRSLKLTANVLRSLAGDWKLTYDNGAVRTYRFDGRGNAHFIEEKMDGTLTRDGDSLKLDFGDGKLERIRLDKDQLLVEHFNPASGYPNSPPLAGRGTRVR